MRDTGGSTYQGRIRIHTGDGHFYAFGSGTYAANTWYTVVGRRKASSKIDCALNGSFGSETTFTRSPTKVWDTTIIGRLGDSSPSNYSDADIAEAAIWNVDLDDAEVSAYNAGMSPVRIRPQSLVLYSQLIRDEDRD